MYKKINEEKTNSSHYEKLLPAVFAIFIENVDGTINSLKKIAHLGDSRTEFLVRYH